MADTYTWIAGTGDYGLATDWADTSSGLSPSPAAPGGTDTARIAAMGTITGTGAAAVLALSSSSGPLSVAGRLAAGTLSLDGTVLVQDGGDVTASGATSLGTTSAASVLIGPQGTLAGSAGATLGAGTVTMLGPAALWSVAGPLDVGSTGAGTMLVAGGGTLAVGGDLLLGDFPGASGPGPITAPSSRLALDGAGSTLSVGGTLVLGGTRTITIYETTKPYGSYAYGPATGTLGVTGGAMVQAASLRVTYAGAIALDALSSIEDGTLGGAALGALTVDPGHTLGSLGGIFTGNLVDDGVATAAGTLIGSVTGSGTLMVGGTVTGSVASGITLANPGLTLGDGAAFASAVTGFSGLSQLRLQGDTASGLTWTGLGSGAGTVTLAGPSSTQAFSLSGSLYNSPVLPLVALPDGGAVTLVSRLPLTGNDAADEQQGILSARAAGLATEVEQLSGTGSFAPAAAGAFNVALSTASTASLPIGYQVGVLDAGGGNETLNGSAGPGGSTYYAGSGADTILGAAAASDTMVVGSGQATLTGGTGADLFVVANGRAGGSALITGFQAGTDHLLLQGFTASGLGTALAQASVSGGSTTLVLPDGTHVTLAGVSGLAAGSVLS